MWFYIYIFFFFFHEVCATEYGNISTSIPGVLTNTSSKDNVISESSLPSEGQVSEQSTTQWSSPRANKSRNITTKILTTVYKGISVITGVSTDRNPPSRSSGDQEMHTTLQVNVNQTDVSYSVSVAGMAEDLSTDLEMLDTSRSTKQTITGKLEQETVTTHQMNESTTKTSLNVNKSDVDATVLPNFTKTYRIAAIFGGFIVFQTAIITFLCVVCTRKRSRTLTINKQENKKTKKSTKDIKGSHWWSPIRCTSQIVTVDNEVNMYDDIQVIEIEDESPYSFNDEYDELRKTREKVNNLNSQNVYSHMRPTHAAV